MSNSTSPRRRRRQILVAGVSVAMIAAPQAHGFERIIRGIDRFAYCAGLMLSDPKKHAENCLPSRAMSPIDSMSDGNSEPSRVTVVVAPPPPPPEVVVPVDCGPTDCGPTDCGPSDCGAPDA